MAKKILSGYKKVKNTLISPMNQITNIEKINWEDSGMPEFIWIALLIKNIGFSRKTTEITEKISKFIQIQFPKKKILTCSDFYCINQDIKQHFLESLSTEDIQSLTLSFENFVYFFLIFLCHF